VPLSDRETMTANDWTARVASDLYLLHENDKWTVGNRRQLENPDETSRLGCPAKMAETNGEKGLYKG